MPLRLVMGSRSPSTFLMLLALTSSTSICRAFSLVRAGPPAILRTYSRNTGSGKFISLIGVLLPAALAVNGSRLNTMARHRKMLRMRFFHLFPPPWFGICGGGLLYQNEPLRPWPPPPEKLLESLELLESLWRSILWRTVVVWVKTSSRRVSCSPSAVT